jgi:hypothetical protein
VIAEVACGSLACFAQSKQDQPSIEQPAAKTSQPESGKEQHQTQQSPIIVNVTPTPKTETERAEEAEDRRRKAEMDSKLVDIRRHRITQSMAN